MIIIGRTKIGVECGQKLYRISSWFPRVRIPGKVRVTPSGKFPKYRRRLLPKLRRWNDGFAFGPLMVWREPKEPFCRECSGPYDGWLLEQYGGHWDSCPNRPKS